jgi:hypothetical protein
MRKVRSTGRKVYTKTVKKAATIVAKKKAPSKTASKKTAGEQTAPPKSRPVDPAHYKRLLAGAGAGRDGVMKSAAASPFESLELARPEYLPFTAAEPDLSHGAITERVDTAQTELRRIVKEYLGDDRVLYDVADEIAATAKPALASIRDGALITDADTLAGLEVIVRTDGSRPSFMVRGGEADTRTSPVGNWDETMRDSAEALRDALACIGRIDDPAGPARIPRHRHSGGERSRDHESPRAAGDRQAKRQWQLDAEAQHCD